MGAGIFDRLSLYVFDQMAKTVKKGSKRGQKGVKNPDFGGFGGSDRIVIYRHFIGQIILPHTKAL